MNKKLMRKKLALMLANLRKKRPYYCEVEYLENTGVSSSRNYISTGIVPDTTTKWEVRLSFNNTTTGKLMGSGYLTGNRFNLGIESNKFRFAFNGWFDANSNITTPDTNPHTWVMDATTKTFTIDEYSITTTQNFGTSTFPIALFGRCNSADGTTESSNAVVGKIYYSKIWQNGILVRDMIPVLDWSYVPCMYDKVTGQLFYNKGTGNFSYGREIHYVEYLESTGTQYIDTGFTPTTKTRWEYDYQFNNTSSSYIGNGMFVTTPSTQRFAIGLIDTSFNMSYGADNVVPVTSDTNRHNFIIDAKNMYWQIDNTTGTYSTVVTATLSRSIYFFARNGGSLYNPHSGKLYGSKIYDNDVLVREYKPAIDENGVGFMFDRATHTIYDNAGTGVFKYPAMQVEYIESYASSTYASQYINTGVNGDNNNLSFDLRFNILAFASYAGVLGNYVSESANCWRLLLTNTNNDTCYATFGGKASSSLGCTITKNAIHDVYMDKNGITIDGVFTPFTGTSGTANSNAIVLFKQYAGTSYGIKMRLYYCNIYNNGTPIRKMFACFKDGTAGMFDTVNNVLYPNTGTGSFGVGKIVESRWF